MISKKQSKWRYSEHAEITPDDWRELDYLVPQPRQPLKGRHAQADLWMNLEYDHIAGKWLPKQVKK